MGENMSTTNINALVTTLVTTGLEIATAMPYPTVIVMTAQSSAAGTSRGDMDRCTPYRHVDTSSASAVPGRARTQAEGESPCAPICHIDESVEALLHQSVRGALEIAPV